MTDQTGPARQGPTERCTCGHTRRDHSGRRDHHDKYGPTVAGRPWCHACEAECIYCPPDPEDPEDTPEPELTLEEARALADDLGLQLYRAQDALAFIAECCDIADREQRTITIADVREWLKGARCGRQLAADAAGTAGYCPSCGRGDVAPSAEEYEQQRQRAERAETELRRYTEADSADAAAGSYAHRAEQAEAAIARVRAYATHIERSGWTGPAIARRIREALDELVPAAIEAAGHVYLSTGCFHGHHDYCQSHTGQSGAKTPASCKFCSAPCVCPCHQEQRPA